MKGKLIVIEGLDGSGKATQSLMLYKSLHLQGFGVKHISFPDYNEPSSSLVKMYLNSEFGNSPSDVNAYAASSFYAVDRYASYMKFWKQNYEKDDIILCDRYVTSNAIYQMAKMDESLWKQYLMWLYDYEYNKLELPKPNCVIYLHVPLDISQRLIEGRYKNSPSEKDLHEKNVEYLERCQKAAKYVSNRDGWKIINCAKDSHIRDVDDIHKEIVRVLKDSGYIE